MKTINLAAYKFIHLTDLDMLRSVLKAECQSISLKGTILLSEEGINFCLAGTPEAVMHFKAFLAKDGRFADIVFKESISDTHPYKRMLVKIKKEIIPLGVEGIDPEHQPAPFISAKQLKAWLDAGEEVVLLDTRNNYEVAFGTFENAVKLDIRHFRHFPKAIKQLPNSLKDKKVVSFCTGGVRCEKAAPFLLQEGYKEVYQLDGGILKYFEECGSAHYQGDCYVFDHRIAVTPELSPACIGQCYICSYPLTAGQQSDPKALCSACEVPTVN